MKLSLLPKLFYVLRDPEAPKTPLTPYMVFAEEEREKVVEEVGEEWRRSRKIIVGNSAGCGLVPRFAGEPGVIKQQYFCFCSYGCQKHFCFCTWHLNKQLVTLKGNFRRCHFWSTLDCSRMYDQGLATESKVLGSWGRSAGLQTSLRGGVREQLWEC